MQERETQLSKNSFASNLQIYAELDKLAGTSGTMSFDRQVIVEFLRSKGWVIEEMARILHMEPEVEVQPEVQPPVLQPAPKMHIIFPSSSSESGSHTDDKPSKCDDDEDDLDNDGDDDVEEEEEEDDDDEHGGTRNSRAFRSAYIGHGNVQAVWAARKAAGLNELFPRSDPVLKEFADFLRLSGAAAKDIANKVIGMCQPLV